MAASGGGGTPASSTLHARRSSKPPAIARRPAAPAKTTATTHSTSIVTATQAAASTPPPLAATLEARGHQLMLDGQYATAVPVLRQAIASASPSSLTYAYALYDLGRSLRLAGDPRDAAQVLWRRLQIPNQTGAVKAELQLALVALGRQAGGGDQGQGGPGPGDQGQGGPGPGNGNGGPGQGGPGPGNGGPGQGQGD